MIFIKLSLIFSLLLSCFLSIYFIIFGFQVFQSLCVSIILSSISWFLTTIIYNWISFSKVLPENKAVLITGCDTGFGYQLAIETDRLGYHVFAGVLFADGDGAKNLLSICSNRLRVLKMDVTNYEEVSNVIYNIKISGIQLWAVVNNAGVAIRTPIEWGFDLNELHQIFSVNVFGTVRVAKLSIPLLRESKGRVINVGSLGGRLTYPGLSFYCMSKHAIRSFSDGLRRELYEFGIKVVIIEPTVYRTPLAEWNPLKKMMNQVWNETPTEVQAVYDEQWRESHEKRTKLRLQFMRKDINEVVNTVLKAITLQEPQFYYRCGGFFEYIFVWPFTYVSELIQDFLLNIFMIINRIGFINRIIDSLSKNSEVVSVNNT